MAREDHQNWSRNRGRYAKYYCRKNLQTWMNEENLRKAVSMEKEVIHLYRLSKKEIGIKYIKHCLRFLYCMPMNGRDFDFWYNEALKYVQAKIRRETATKAAKEIGKDTISTKDDMETVMLNCLRGSNIGCSTKEFIRSVV